MEKINSLFGGVLLPVLLLSAGAFLSLRFGLFWMLHPLRTLRAMGKRGLRSLCLALAGTLGVGNITGVALAIAFGGAGAVFWMWISALAAMALKYAEVALALQTRTGKGAGAMYYLPVAYPGKTGRCLGGLYALLCLGTALTMGSMVQSSAAASAMTGMFRTPPLLCGVVMAVLCFAVVLGGAKWIGNVTSVLIPLLTLVYIFVSMWIILRNAAALPEVFARIIRGALSPAAMAGGAFGAAVRHGIARGVLSNEAGCGTSAMAHATAENTPAAQGIAGIAEVFVDTILLCTMTALVILLCFDPVPAEDGMTLALSAYGQTLGQFAGLFVGCSVVLFAFATVLCWAYYGLNSLAFFTARRGAQVVFLLLFCLSMAAGAAFTPTVVFGLCDLFLALLCFLNVPALLRLSGRVPLPWARQKKAPSPTKPVEKAALCK